MPRELRGILPALMSPLNGDHSVNVPVMRELLARLYAANIDGLYVCGNTGQGLLLSIDARRTMLETVVRHSPPGKLVIAHVGADNLNDAVELARHAAETGADAISSLPPSSADFEQVEAY